MSNQISGRRALANSFYLTVNGVIMALIGIIIQNGLYLYSAPVSLIGLLFAFSWGVLIYQYKKLNRAKFKIINKIEEKLPVMGFTVEWKILAQGKKRSVYWLLTDIEMIVPSLLFLVYFIILTLSTFQYFILPFVQGSSAL